VSRRDTGAGWRIEELFNHAAEMKIDSVQSDGSPGKGYRTMALAGVFVCERGLFMEARKPAEARHPPPFMVAEGAFAPLPECS